MRNLRVQSIGLCRYLPKCSHPQFSLAVNSLSLYMSQLEIHRALNSVLGVLGDGRWVSSVSAGACQPNAILGSNIHRNRISVLCV